MDGTIIQQGSFTSTGTAVSLNIRSDVDWMRVVNLTRAAGSDINTGVEFYWQRGFAVNNGIVYWHAAASQVLSMTTSATGIGAGAVPGFTLLDTSSQTPGPAVALTAVSNANPPRVTTGSTATLSTGDVVRLINVTGAQQVSGIDFRITVVSGTTFDLSYAGAGMVTVAGTNGFWRKLPNPPIYAPRTRTIVSISQATQAVVTTTTDHGYAVGMKVRFVIPEVTALAYGMTELNNQSATIVAVTTSTFTIDVDTTGYTAFAWPLTANVAFTPATVEVFGDNTATALAQVPPLSSLEDAVNNISYIGMLLGAGAASPAGQNNDVIYWRAGKSFNV